MNIHPALAAAGALLAPFLSAHAAPVTGPAFYGDPPDEHHPWAIHDPNRPQPPLVTPGTPSTQDRAGKPPSDAIIVFGEGDTGLSKWEADKSPPEPTKWIVKDGAMQCVPGSGYVRTKDGLGDGQLHIEWAAPAEVKGDSQGRGNSGVFIMGNCEIQVLDDYNNPTYADGFAGSVYGVSPPLANPLLPPGQWQTYDIVFRRPIHKNGQEVDPGYVTVFVNGVLVQDHTPPEGGGGHKARSKSHAVPEKSPLKLQDHGNPVRYRNIWFRPLPPRAIEGGTDGALTTEATAAKRKEIAAAIRTDAAKLTGLPKLLRTLESLTYEKNDAALAQSTTMAAEYLQTIKQTPADRLDSKKGEVMQLRNAVQYLTKASSLPAAFPPKDEIEKLVKERGWDEKK